MNAAALLLVFVFAKLAVLHGHVPSWHLQTIAAYFWQDVVAVLALAGLGIVLEQWRPGQLLASSIYWLVVLYAALNIPVGRALFTPLTWPMLQAARGPLVDSFLQYATWTNSLLMALTVVAATLPALLRRRLAPAGFEGGASSRTRTLASGAVAAAAAFAALGSVAAAHVDTRGLDRNVLTALLPGTLPRIAAHEGAANWRQSPFEREPTADLSALRAIARGRNVVLVSLESTAAQYLTLYGGAGTIAPELDALAEHGLVFDAAYAAYPESIKGLFSVLCSTFPAFDIAADEYARVPCESLAAVLSERGYRTGLFHSGRFDYLGMQSVIRSRGYQTLADAGDIGGHHDSSFGIDEPSTVSSMLAWIDAAPGGQPFFLTYLPIAGHHPYETPIRGPFPNVDDMGRYRNALYYGDRSLGALADGLKNRGLGDKTLWIIAGDHGEAFGQHEGNFGHTFFVFDENVRVPLVLAVPGAIRIPMRSRKVVSLVDLAPTVLDLLGIAPPASYQGQSMLDSTPRMALFFADYSLGLLGLCDGRWKFIHEIGSGRSQLFDLARDPQEKTDVSTANVDRVRWYRQDLLGWSAVQRDRIVRQAGSTSSNVVVP